MLAEYIVIKIVEGLNDLLDFEEDIKNVLKYYLNTFNLNEWSLSSIANTNSLSKDETELPMHVERP